MNFRFRKRIKSAPGLAINLSKGWPSLSIGGHCATVNLGRRGPRATLGIPGTGMNWQFGGHQHIHKTVQAQADIKAVHAQGTIRAVEAQADLIAITKRMETVAKRLTRNSAGSACWKKAASEQAQLLEELMEVATASENDQLIAAVQKCHDAWRTEPSIEEAAVWKTAGRNLILPVIACGLIAVVYTVAAHKTTSHAAVVESAMPTSEAPATMPAPEAIAASPTSEAPAATPASQPSTPPSSSVKTALTASQHDEMIPVKAVRQKHSTHNSTRRPDR